MTKMTDDQRAPAAPPLVLQPSEPERLILTVEHLERMRIPARYYRVAFTGVSEGAHKEALRRYLTDLDDLLARGVGLVLSGPNGSGKTSCAVLVLKEAARRGVFGVFGEAASIRDVAFSKKSFDGEQALWERWQQAPVLVLDDLGKGVTDSVAAAERLLDELLRHRGMAKRLTIVTTNLRTVGERPGDLSPLEQYLKASTLAMLQETALLVSVVGPDLRVGALDDVREALGPGARAFQRPSVIPPQR